MRGAWGAPCRLLPLLLLLSQRTSVRGSPGPLRCYGVGPLGDLNCSWEPLGDLGAPSTLHLQSQKYMAKHPLPLLLAMWVLVGGLWLEAKGKKDSDKGKLCGLELARAIIRTCDKPQQKRSDNLAQEAMGDAFPHTEPYAHSQLGEAAGASDWAVLTKPAQDSYGSLRVTRKDQDGGSLLKKCCRKGCEEKELEIFCKEGIGGLDWFGIMAGGPGQGMGIWEDEDQC